MRDERGSSEELMASATDGDEAALAAVFAADRGRLRRMVQLRLDRRLQGRIDPSDVLQESFIEMARRLPEYSRNPTMPLFLWMRFITAQQLLQLHRRHLGTAMRDAGLEVSLYHGSLPTASSASLAAQLMGHWTTASQAAIRAELQLQLQENLNQMDAIDREVLALRHFEELTNAETAEVLQISPATASKRYIQALRRLRKMLSGIPGFFETRKAGL